MFFIYFQILYVKQALLKYLVLVHLLKNNIFKCFVFVYLEHIYICSLLMLFCYVSLFNKNYEI